MKTLTLEEYINQEVPVRGNKVVLQPDEYTIRLRFKQQNGIETILGVKGFEQYEYSLLNDSGWLYPVSSDGNRKNLSSVFYIEKLVTNKVPFNDKSLRKKRKRKS